MPEHRWAPPIHPDPPEDQPLGKDAPPAPDRVSGADGDVVYVQLVHMGFVHHVWLPLARIKKRALQPQGRR